MRRGEGVRKKGGVLIGKGEGWIGDSGGKKC